MNQCKKHKCYMPIMREENGYNIRECPRCTLEKESIEDEITKRKFKC